jgi:hypothetical protein
MVTAVFIIAGGILLAAAVLGLLGVGLLAIAANWHELAPLFGLAFVGAVYWAAWAYVGPKLFTFLCLFAVVVLADEFGGLRWLGGKVDGLCRMVWRR